MTLADILPVCPDATPMNVHTLIEVVPESNRWFCRNDKCNLAYIIKTKEGQSHEVWIGERERIEPN